MSDAELAALLWSGLIAAVLAAIHLASPRLRPATSRHQVLIGSLGGGMAVAYVFLHLFAAIEKGHAIFGDRIHLIVLLGFLLYYGAERGLGKSGQGETRSYELWLHLAMAWLYSWLLIYALPDALLANGAAAIPPTIALGLHVMNNNFHMSAQFKRPFDRWGVWVLASAPIVGWATDVFYFEDNPLVSDILVALLAGAILYNVFSQELPDHDRSSFGWLLVGVVTFVLLDFIP